MRIKLLRYRCNPTTFAALPCPTWTLVTTHMDLAAWVHNDNPFLLPDGMAENMEVYDVYTSARAANIAAKAKAGVIARDHGEESLIKDMGTMPMPDGSRDVTVAVPTCRLWLCKILYDRGEEIGKYLNRKKMEITMGT
ncbi:hypothetical protein MMC10_003015 [Thelotrema lepadinum]|nr:hypothetical protein [Thelotrema lepadinum]